jgi:hypothetical protein
MATPALNLIKDNAYLNYVLIPLLYTQNVLDKNHSGLISVKEASKDPIFQSYIVDNLTLFSDYSNNVTSINIVINDTKLANDTNISINNELKPRLVKQFEEYVKKLNNNQAPVSDERCLSDLDQFRCLMWPRSHLLSPRPLSIIGNVSSNIGILILMGENDAVEQAFLLQQRLAEINHPDHTRLLIQTLVIISILQIHCKQVFQTRKPSQCQNMSWQIFIHGLKVILDSHPPIILHL